jgi:predicted ATP-dependent endonuclease of OLD family
VRSAAYEQATSRESDRAFERLRDEERLVEREANREAHRKFGLYAARDQQSSLTARKTIQCREWFGPFVPVVRYPSILEVTDSLATEFRDAQIETGMQERQMLSEMFVEVFKALVSDEAVPTESELDTLMSRVRNAIADERGTAEDQMYTDQIGYRLSQAIGVVKERGNQKGSEAERRVLRLYAQMLERRNNERSTAFAKVKHFEAAVNKFFDSKTLHITDERKEGNVYVETPDGRRYGLASLSSGERQVLTMLFSATRMSSATGVFLMDEPELSLHIDWQRIILGELTAQAGGRQIIACTHSPEVGAEHISSVQIFQPTPTINQLPDRSIEDSILDESL